MILEAIYSYRSKHKIQDNKTWGFEGCEKSVGLLSAALSCPEICVFEDKLKSYLDEVGVFSSYIEAPRLAEWDSWGVVPPYLKQKTIRRDCLFVLREDFLFSLNDPRPLLLSLKRAMLVSESYLLILDGGSTWSISVPDYLRSCGFVEKKEAGVSFYQCKFEDYANYLMNCGVEPDLLRGRTLLVTTEDASVQKTGGIGTYVKNIKNINATVPVLLVDDSVLIDGTQLTSTFTPSHFFNGYRDREWFEGALIVEFVQGLLFLLPNLSVIEFQDHLSIGMRITQARASGLLPRDIWLRVFLHGNVDYLKFGANVSSEALWYSLSEAESVSKDRYIFKSVDECVAPSEYLAKKLMVEEYGYEMSSLKTKRLPFDLNILKEYRSKNLLQRPTKIVFIGKYSDLKGWPDFLKAIGELFVNSELQCIREIWSLAPGQPPSSDYKYLSNFCRYRAMHLSHGQLLDFIHINRSEAIFVVPSRGENYPFVVLEQMLLGTRFVAYNAGGAPEVVDDADFVQKFFCDPSPCALAQKIVDVADYDLETTELFLSQSSERVYKRQLAVNEMYDEARFDADIKKDCCVRAYFEKDVGNVGIVIPVFNTPFSYLNDLRISILCQSVAISELLLVDDGSEEAYGKELEEWVRSHDWGIEARIIRQANKGLSGARNTGAKEVSSEYVLFVDSDDVLLPWAVSHMREALIGDSELVSVNGFSYYFNQMETVPSYVEQICEGKYWKPIGAVEARALSLFQNQYLNANAMFRRSRIFDFGGWDDSDRSTWEDWAFYSKIAWQGGKILLLPEIVSLYRNSPGSMSKTYNVFFGKRRLVRNIPGLSKFDANIILSLKNRGGGFSATEAELIMIIRRLSEIVVFRKLMRWGLLIIRCCKKNKMIKKLFFKIAQYR